MRHAFCPGRRKRPNGRFWIGKSVSGALADSTQLASAGSCVSSTFTVPRSGRLNDAAAKLIALERFEQRLEVAFAEALVALALDELEEHRTEQRLREDLEEQPLLAAFGGSVQEDAARLQLVNLFVVSWQTLLEHLVVGRGRGGHQRDARLAQAVDAGVQIVGEERDVLDALAVELHQEFFDLAGRLRGLLVERDADL